MATSGEVGGQGNNSTGILNKLDNAGGLWGVVTGAPRAGGSLAKRILVGRRRNTDPKAPQAELRYSQFVSSVDDKTPVYDKHGRLVSSDKREDLNPELNKKMKENVYPAMEKFWTQHIERLSSVVNTYPHLLQDKSSYIYYQYMQARSLCVDAGADRLGQPAINKIQAYFQTSKGYNETMRYMEEEMTRLEQANNLIMLMQKQHQPGGFDAVNLGIMSAQDRRDFILRFGTGMAVSLEALLVGAYFVRTFGAFVPGILTALPPLVLTTLGPWAIGAAVAAVPFGLMIQRLDQLAKTNTPGQIMQECNSMWYAITNRPAESAYMRVMYGIDPNEFRFDQTQQKLVLDRDLATGGWEQSKNSMLSIKESRRLFYDALGIRNPNMFGVPEEAFFDAQGNYRPYQGAPIRPEGRGMIYQQDIWNRYKDLGGHVIIDATSGQPRHLYPHEAIQRFQQARREVIIAGVESQASTLIENDRKNSTLKAQRAIIDQRKTSVEVGGKVHDQQAKSYDSDIELYTKLNEGEGGKPGMVAYTQEWKGAAGSVEDRLRGISDVRKEVNSAISVLIPFSGNLEDISEHHIKTAIAAIDDRLDPKKTNSEAEAYENAKKYLDTNPPKVPDPSLPPLKGGATQMVDNPRHPAALAAHDAALAKVEKLKTQREQLVELSQKLANKRAEYQRSNEHGKAYAEIMRKMKDAYDTLVSAAGNRNTAIGPVLNSGQVDTILRSYPHSSFQVEIVNNAPPPPRVIQTRPGRMDWIMFTLVNESSKPPWAATENNIHEHRMMIVHAVAYSRAQESLSKSVHASKHYDTANTKKVGDFFNERDLDGTFNEMLLLASNDAELQAMGTKGGIDMAIGDNTSLRAYARERYDTFAGSAQWIVDEQAKLKEKAEKDKLKVADRLMGEKERYELVAELITDENGADQSKKISAQTWIRRLTGDAAVVRLTDRQTYAIKKNIPEEMARYQDYEKRFMQKFTSFPPGMLEFLDVVFQYRTDVKGEEKLKHIYELLVEMDVDGVTQKQEPQILLADMIYASHPSIREMLLVTREQVMNQVTIGGYKITESWDNVVLRAFQNRQSGFAPPPPIFKPTLPSPFSCSEMNGIMTSIQHQIIDKAVRTGARVNPMVNYDF